MPSKNKGIPKRIEKLIYQEAGSQCPFCGEAEVSALQVHHIVGKEHEGSDEPENLILACATCHTKITASVITISEVIAKKLRLAHSINSQPRFTGNNVTVGGNVSQSIVGNVVNLRTAAKTMPKIAYPNGAIGADLIKKNYVSYLISKYFECRKADSSFGRERNFSHPEIHKTLEKQFGARTFFIQETFFNDVCEYLKGRINKTILGRNNLSKGMRIYKSFEEYSVNPRACCK